MELSVILKQVEDAKEELNKLKGIKESLTAEMIEKFDVSDISELVKINDGLILNIRKLEKELDEKTNILMEKYEEIKTRTT